MCVEMVGGMALQLSHPNAARRRASELPGLMQWRSLPAFREKSPAYLDAVDAYLPALSALSVQQRRDLAVFKAAELLNALIQIRERRQAPDRLGDAFAKASFQRVRQVQIAAGGLVLLGLIGSQVLAPAWIALSWLVGAGLVFAGISGFCGMARLLAMMPWNRVRL